jgi:hypothetical protein
MITLEGALGFLINLSLLILFVGLELGFIALGLFLSS